VYSAVTGVLEVGRVDLWLINLLCALCGF